MKKAREFWIGRKHTEKIEGMVCFYPAVATNRDMLLSEYTNEIIHVIENQAYDDLKAQADALALAMDQIRHGSVNDENGYGLHVPDGTLRDWANKALQSYENFKKGMSDED